MIRLLLLIAFLFNSASMAANLPAKSCQIFIKSLSVIPSSHGQGSLGVTVKVNWIGDGEQVRRVGAYQHDSAIDLGNQPGCHWTSGASNRWRIVDGAPGSAIGESRFSFRIESGSVASECPGFHYINRVAFFVETDRNTYWVNSGFNPDTPFVLDSRAYEQVMEAGSYFNPVSTARDDLRYFNPASCR